jgi:platelet-activating factor acetylhydrolase IB subunit alpha
MALTERQKKDMHKAMLEYLLTDEQTFRSTIEAFRREANITEPAESGKNLLEKKWTSVVRLQKRVMELEAQLSTMPKLGAAGGTGGSSVIDSIMNGGKAGIADSSRNLPKGPAVSTLSGHRAPVTAVKVHPKYSIVASASEDSTIKLWDYETGQYDRTLKGHTGPVTGLTFDANGTMLASCSADMSAKLWDMTTFACTKTLRGHDHTLSGIQFLASGDHLITCSRDTTIKCWEVATGYCTKTYAGHSDWVKAISVSLDGEMFASGGIDQSIIVWRISTGQVIQVGLV